MASNGVIESNNHIHNHSNSNKNYKTPSPQPSSGNSKKNNGHKSTPSKKVIIRSNDDEQSFNGDEIIHYLHQSYQQYLQQAKHDKQGEMIKIYKSLDSSSPWKSNHSASTSNNNIKTNNNNNNNKSFNKSNGQSMISKDVLRNNGSSSLDILFEINRSIYQSQHN